MRDIGVDVKMPSGEWDGDENCPFFGSLRLRGQVLEGIVAKLGMQGTIIIERNIIASTTNIILRVGRRRVCLINRIFY